MDPKNPTIDIDPNKEHYLHHWMKLAGKGMKEDKIRPILRAAEEYLKRVAGNATFNHRFKWKVEEVYVEPTPKSPAMWFTEIFIVMEFKGVPGDEARKIMAEAAMIENAKREARDAGIWNYFSDPLNKAKA